MVLFSVGTSVFSFTSIFLFLLSSFLLPLGIELPCFSLARLKSGPLSHTPMTSRRLFGGRTSAGLFKLPVRPFPIAMQKIALSPCNRRHLNLFPSKDPPPFVVRFSPYDVHLLWVFPDHPAKQSALPTAGPFFRFSEKAFFS